MSRKLRLFATLAGILALAGTQVAQAQTRAGAKGTKAQAGVPQGLPPSKLKSAPAMAGAAASPRAAASQPLTQTATARPKSVLFPIVGQKELSHELHQAIVRIGVPVQLSSLGPEELMLAVGCSGFSISCLQEVGKMVQSKSLIFPTLSKVAGTQKLSLRWFDTQSGADAGKAALTVVAEVDARAQALERATRKLFGMPPRSALALPNTGELVVVSNLPLVEVLLNGQPRGTAPLRLRNLGPGRYRIVASRPGFASSSSTVTVEAGQISRLELQLKRSGPAPARSTRFIDAIGPQTWIVAGIGATALALGIGFAADLVSSQNEFDRLDGNTAYEIQRMSQLKSAGDRDAVVANVMFSLAGAMVVTAAVLSYVDYRSSQRRTKAVDSELASKTPSFRLALGFGNLALGLRF